MAGWVSTNRFENRGDGEMGMTIGWVDWAVDWVETRGGFENRGEMDDVDDNDI